LITHLISHIGPHGTTDKEKDARNLMFLIKQEKLISNPPIAMSEYIARKIAGELAVLPFKNFFGRDVFLVPIPKSSLMATGTLWVPHRLVQALCKFNLGSEFNCLTRIKPVNKAAFAKPGDRPTAIGHYETISVQKKLESPKQILLVDDVVTRGATLLGSASRLHEAFPDAVIRGFAVLRTVSESKFFDRVDSPTIGTIKLNNGNTYRRP